MKIWSDGQGCRKRAKARVLNTGRRAQLFRRALVWRLRSRSVIVDSNQKPHFSLPCARTCSKIQELLLNLHLDPWNSHSLFHDYQRIADLAVLPANAASGLIGQPLPEMHATLGTRTICHFADPQRQRSRQTDDVVQRRLFFASYKSQIRWNPAPQSFSWSWWRLRFLHLLQEAAEQSAPWDFGRSHPSFSYLLSVFALLGPCQVSLVILKRVIMKVSKT